MLTLIRRHKIISLAAVALFGAWLVLVSGSAAVSASEGNR